MRVDSIDACPAWAWMASVDEIGGRSSSMYAPRLLKKARGDRHDPLPTALPFRIEQPPLADVDVGHAEPEYLATS